MENTIVNQQWLSRPSDQRYTSLPDMHKYMLRIRQNSVGKVVSSRSLSAAPVNGDNKALMIAGPGGNPVSITNWAFGQLSARAGAPAGYLRSLPTPLAADCINFGLQCNRDVEDIGVLLHRADTGTELRAATGPNYGRIWNEAIVRELMERFGDGVTGVWKVPGEFGKDVPITKENTTLYASDRDMFVFLADEKNRITLPNRRDGKSGSLARGLYVKNSEVGSELLEVGAYLFDYACSNRTLWGVNGFETIKIRHTAKAPDRWLEEATPALRAYSEASEAPIVSILEAAQKAKIDKVDEFLMKRFTKTQSTAIKNAHMADENRPIETLWDASVGITAYARGIQWQDERTQVEKEAGKVLDLAF